jgi:hypothetical protein
MSLEQSAARRTEVGPVQTITVGPVQSIVPTGTLIFDEFGAGRV